MARANKPKKYVPPDDEKSFILANGRVARYKKVGACNVCKCELYHCTTHPIRADDQIAVAVYVNPGPTLYCRKHDPTAGIRHEGVKPGEEIPGEAYLRSRPFVR